MCLRLILVNVCIVNQQNKQFKPTFLVAFRLANIFCRVNERKLNCTKQLNIRGELKGVPFCVKKLSNNLSIWKVLLYNDFDDLIFQSRRKLRKVTTLATFTSKNFRQTFRTIY